MSEYEAAIWREKRAKGFKSFIITRTSFAVLALIVVNFVIPNYFGIQPYSIFELIPFFILSSLFVIVRWLKNEYRLREFERGNTSA